MGKYTDAALAAHAAREQAERDAETAERAALVDRAKAKAAPLWTGADGKPLVDSLKAVTAEHVDAGHGLVVLAVLDDKAAPEAWFAVYPDTAAPVRMVEPEDGGFTGYGGTGLDGPVVADLDDVGAVLAGDS